MENENRNDGFYLPDWSAVNLSNQLVRTSRAVIGRIENHVGVTLFNPTSDMGLRKSYYDIGEWDFINPQWDRPSIKIIDFDVSDDISWWVNDKASSCSLTLSTVDVNEMDWYKMMDDYLASNPKINKMSGRDRQRFIQDQTKKYGVMNRKVVMAGSTAGEEFQYQIAMTLSDVHPYNYHLLTKGTFLDFDFRNQSSTSYPNTLLSLMSPDNKLQLANWLLTGLVHAQEVVDISSNPPVEVDW